MSNNSRSDLHSLLTRVEAATGPDRELDAHIMCALNGYTMHEDSNPNDGIFAFWDGAPWKSTCHNCTIWPSPTASLDAALALVGEMLPGSEFEMGSTSPPEGEGQFWAVVWARQKSKRISQIATANTLPLAVLSALLRALIAKQEVADA